MASFHGEVVITTGTQSISGNYTPVTASFYAVRDSGSAYSGYTTYASCTLDGTTETKTISSYNLNSSNTRILLGSITKNVYHNSDGTKTVSASFSWNTQNSYSGTISGSTTKTLTTIPRTSNVSLSSTNFNIGNTITINTNRASSSFTHTAVIKFNGSTVRTQTGIGANYSWNTSELYQYIPKANSAKGTVTLTTYSGSTSIGSSPIDFTANVTNSNPTFSNCTYEDIGEASTQLTGGGNNQTLINGFNKLQVTISTANKAIEKNGAKMARYRLTCGNNTPVEVPYSSTSDVTLTMENITDKKFIIYAIDSRENSTKVEKTIPDANWKNYSPIVIKKGSAIRDGGVGTKTTLTFEGSLWNDSFGAETNGIVTCQYKYKKSNESTYGEPIDITPTISGNSFSFSSTIKGDADAEGFNVSNSFNIQVVVTDKIKTATYDILLGAGTPAMAIHRNGVAFGAPYDEDEGGPLQIKGKQVFALEKPAMMTFYNSGSGSQSINVTATYNPYLIEFGSYCSVGNKFSISNNKIVIGKGVTKVLVSGMLSVNRGKTSDMVYMQILKNDEIIAYVGTHFTDWAQAAMTANDVLIDVQEGDTISMIFATGSETGTYEIRKGLSMTRLTVKAVEE